MKNNISLLIIFALILFSSCEDVIVLELPEAETQLVVDGWLTDQVGEKQVLLSTSTNYFDNTPSPFVEDALVVLYEGVFAIDTLFEKTKGLYTTNYVGQTGKTYHIYIRTQTGEEYESNQETLEPVPAITAIRAEFKEESTFDDEGYYVSIDTNEPLGIGNFYRWKQFVNDEPLKEPFDLLFASDEFVDGNPIIDFEVTINDPLILGDRYLIQQLSISETAYDFFTQLQLQTAFIGSLFDSPPIALQGNIINLNSSGKKPLGYFGVSAVSEKTIVIE